MATIPLAIFIRVFLLPPGLMVSASLATSAGVNFRNEQRGHEISSVDIDSVSCVGMAGLGSTGKLKKCSVG